MLEKRIVFHRGGDVLKGVCKFYCNSLEEHGRTDMVP